MLAIALLTTATAAGAPTVEAIEAAHGAKTLRAHEAIKVRIELRFGGQPRLFGELYASADGGRTRIEFDSGKTIVFDGQTAWLSPADATQDGARFDALTWSYFLLAPFKLGDPGARYRPVGPRPWVEAQMRPAAKLTFGDDVGDAPDDWYVVFADPERGLVEGLAYIVTFGDRSEEEAEEEPHAIIYSDHETIDGVTLAKRWSFRLWTKEKGVFGEALGSAEISDVVLVQTIPPELFQRPEGAKEISAP